MKYIFKTETELEIDFPNSELASQASISIGNIAVEPSGELNDDQLATVQSELSTALSSKFGVPITVELVSKHI